MKNLWQEIGVFRLNYNFKKQLKQYPKLTTEKSKFQKRRFCRNRYLPKKRIKFTNKKRKIEIFIKIEISNKKLHFWNNRVLDFDIKVDAWRKNDLYMWHKGLTHLKHDVRSSHHPKITASFFFVVFKYRPQIIFLWLNTMFISARSVFFLPSLFKIVLKWATLPLFIFSVKIFICTTFVRKVEMIEEYISC